MPTRDKIIIITVGLIFAFIAVRQIYWNENSNKLTQPEQANALAMEVAELIKTNTDLRQEVDTLSTQYNQLSASLDDKQLANETLEKSLNQYRIILGTTKVQGEGVEITFKDKISSTQMIDLINALKNMGAEAIAIKNQRLVPNSFVDPGLFNPPTVVQVIGAKDVLEEALNCKGGILNQIGSGVVSKQDSLILPAGQ